MAKISFWYGRESRTLLSPLDVLQSYTKNCIMYEAESDKDIEEETGDQYESEIKDYIIVDC